MEAGLGHRRAALGCAVLAWAVAGLAAAASQGFCLDDAFIHLSYARSLLLGEGLSYNPGDWETGASSPLWVLALVPFAGLDDPARAVQILGVLLHGATALAAALGAARLVAPERARPAAWVAGVLVALHPGLVQGAISGMEVALTALLLALSLPATLCHRVRLAFVLGLLAVLARPEALLLLAAIGALCMLSERDHRPLAAAAGAGTGLLLWVGYCLVVSGYPWPNTRYVKGEGALIDGVAYLAAQVVPQEPWLLGLGGLVLVALQLRRQLPRSERMLPLLLLGAWLAAALAVAFTRDLDPALLFFHGRYFLPLSVAPAIAIGVACAGPRASLRLAWLAPVLLLALWSGLAVQARQRLQEANIARLHVHPSRHLATHLPASAVVLVEGAGASRYFAPRSMTIVDALGLNHRAIAHLPRARKPCAFVAARPSHLLLPGHMRAAVLPLFRTTALKRWVEPRFAQSVGLFAVQVTLYRVDGLTDVARGHCPTEAAPR